MTTTNTQGAMPEALIEIAREIEALKRPCGMDPESPVAVQNGRYMSLSYKVRDLAAQVAAITAAPADWPTNAMIEAGRKAAATHGPLLGNGQSLWHVFRDMLAAAPAQPAPGVESNTAGAALEEDQWLELAQRHANADWNCDKPDGFLNAVKALCTDFEALRASHGQAPAGAAGGLPIAQEPKYTVTGDHIVNRTTGEAVPHDEPVFVFRARDALGVRALQAYLALIGEREPSSEHADAVRGRIADFQRFAASHPERMKWPDTTAQAAPAAGAVAGPGGWHELAAKVFDALADAQEQTNASCPAHVEAYPSWKIQARWLRWHAQMFRTGKPIGNGAGQPAVLAALAAAPTPAAQADSGVQEDAARLDNCTDPYNCKRCKAHPNHRNGLEHAGIPYGRATGAKP